MAALDTGLQPACQAAPLLPSTQRERSSSAVGLPLPRAEPGGWDPPGPLGKRGRYDQDPGGRPMARGDAGPRLHDRGEGAGQWGEWRRDAAGADWGCGGGGGERFGRVWGRGRGGSELRGGDRPAPPPPPFGRGYARRSMSPPPVRVEVPPQRPLPRTGSGRELRLSPSRESPRQPPYYHPPAPLVRSLHRRHSGSREVTEEGERPAQPRPLSYEERQAARARRSGSAEARERLPARAGDVGRGRDGCEPSLAQARGLNHRPPPSAQQPPSASPSPPTSGAAQQPMPRDGGAGTPRSPPGMDSGSMGSGGMGSGGKGSRWGPKALCADGGTRAAPDGTPRAAAAAAAAAAPEPLSPPAVKAEQQGQAPWVQPRLLVEVAAAALDAPASPMSPGASPTAAAAAAWASSGRETPDLGHLPLGAREPAATAADGAGAAAAAAEAAAALPRSPVSPAAPAAGGLGSPASLPPGFRSPLMGAGLSKEISFLKQEHPTLGTVAADAAANAGRVAETAELAARACHLARLGDAQLSGVDHLPAPQDRAATPPAPAHAPPAPVPDRSQALASDELLARVQGLDTELAGLQAQLAELRGEQGRLQQREAQVAKALARLQARPPRPPPAPVSESEEEEEEQEEEVVEEGQEEAVEEGCLGGGKAEPEGPGAAAAAPAAEAAAAPPPSVSAPAPALAAAAARDRQLCASKRARLLAAVRAAQARQPPPLRARRRVLRALEVAVSHAAAECGECAGGLLCWSSELQSLPHARAPAAHPVPPPRQRWPTCLLPADRARPPPMPS